MELQFRPLERGRPSPSLSATRMSPKWLFLAFILAFVVTASGAAMAQDAPSNEAEDNTSPAQEVVVKPAADDDAISDRLAGILKASGWFSAVSVRVNEGIAFLNGRTESDERRAWAGNLARQTQDVVAVVNRIEVQPSFRWDWTPAWLEARKLGIQIVQTLPLVLLGTFVLAFAWFLAASLAAGAQLVLRPRVASPLLRTVIARAIALPVFLLGLYLVLQVSGLTRLALTVLGGTGLIGIVIGFAFRDIAENFLASLLLSVRNPFQDGDFISVAGHDGIVRNLNTRSTVLLTLDGRHVRIPNATVFKSVIVNHTSNKNRRDTISVGIGYDDDVTQARDVIVSVLSTHPAVRDDPPPQVLVDELAASSVKVITHYWFDGDEHSPPKLKSALLIRLKEALSGAGISMPDEAREVIFPNGVPITRQPPSERKAGSGVGTEQKRLGGPVTVPERRHPREDTHNDELDAARRVEDDAALSRETNLLKAE
jgi:small conductance mechanosensitive channel